MSVVLECLLFIQPYRSDRPVNMENLPVNNNNGQSFGYTLYETTITCGETLNSRNGIRDRALVRKIRLNTDRHRQTHVNPYVKLNTVFFLFPHFALSFLSGICRQTICWLFGLQDPGASSPWRQGTEYFVVFCGVFLHTYIHLYIDIKIIQVHCTRTHTHSSHLFISRTDLLLNVIHIILHLRERGLWAFLWRIVAEWIMGKLWTNNAKVFWSHVFDQHELVSIFSFFHQLIYLNFIDNLYFSHIFKTAK